ncbi:MAG TPA: alkaline phosphatase family protein [Candidatus Dormibacteraeota bacterium]|nr:alkaline phosphatase family protein [Candidatus Dormibacteraeota bacterium]
MRKLLVIGLDSAPPELVFEKFRDKLPNISALMENGVYARMRSCHPPITVPAWMVMATSKSPGKLGLYGFRHRKGYAYTGGWIANSQSVREEKVWDILARAGNQVCLVGVPPSYPPSPVKGNMISCFMTPGSDREYTYPPELKKEVEGLVGPYPFDVEFRIDNREELHKNLIDMTEKHFQVIEHLLTTREWDFFMFVEIGLDRMHHAFWKYFDKTHPKYEKGNQFEAVALDYYLRLDEHIGRLIAFVPEETVVVVVSDHGAKGMRGAFCVNEWLIQEGYLVLKEEPRGVVEIDKAMVDWTRTKAWAWGGYYARVFFNVKGRETNGVIDPVDLKREQGELTRRLKEIRDPTGRLMETKVYRPEELYPVSVGDKPDLIVYFDDLYWRSAGTIGHGGLYLAENDTGPDDAVHAQYGIFIMRDKELRRRGKVPDIDILDVMPTLLSRLGVSVPSTMEGKPVSWLS